MIKMIVAVDSGNAIGWKDGRLPWKIPADMKRFKALTTGHDVLMGYNTFKSLNLPKGLPNRRNFVVTQSHAGEVDNPVTDLQGWVHAHQEVLGAEPPDLWVIGGATIYEQLLELQLIDEIYLTQVLENSGADVKIANHLFDYLDFCIHQNQEGATWRCSEQTFGETLDGLKFYFVTLRKIQ
jgi:dihydrofolate reductase